MDKPEVIAETRVLFKLQSGVKFIGVDEKGHDFTVEFERALDKFEEETEYRARKFAREWGLEVEVRED